MGSFTKLKQLFEEKNSFLAIGHIKPDGDSIGSLLALREFFLNNGKKIDLVCKDPIPSIFSFLPEINYIHPDYLAGGYDAIILVDNGDLKRTGFADRLLRVNQDKIAIVNLDHHPKNDIWKMVRVNYAREEEAATATIVFKLLESLEYKMSSRMATMLLLGVYTDTGGFSHTNTSKEVLEIVSNLLSLGGDLRKISSNVSFARDLTTLKLWGAALAKLRYVEKFNFLYSTISQEEIQLANASDDEVSGLVTLINSVPEADFALLLYETNDGNIKGSLRTEKDNVDVSKLAKALGGGGHKKAAGFEIRSTKLESLVDDLVQAAVAE